MEFAAYREKKYQQSQVHAQRAVEILERLWKNIADEQFGYQDVNDDGMFKRLDIINGGYREDTIKRDQFT